MMERKETGINRPLLRGDSGSRTHDLQIANLSLYQLSYIPDCDAKYIFSCRIRQAKTGVNRIFLLWGRLDLAWRFSRLLVHYSRTISRSRVIPNLSRTVRCMSSASAVMSFAVAPPAFTMKFACRVLTSAPPMRVPLRPAASM